MSIKRMSSGLCLMVSMCEGKHHLIGVFDHIDLSSDYGLSKRLINESIFDG